MVLKEHPTLAARTTTRRGWGTPIERAKVGTPIERAKVGTRLGERGWGTLVETAKVEHAD